MLTRRNCLPARFGVNSLVTRWQRSYRHWRRIGWGHNIERRPQLAQNDPDNFGRVEYDSAFWAVAKACCSCCFADAVRRPGVADWFMVTGVTRTCHMHVRRTARFTLYHILKSTRYWLFSASICKYAAEPRTQAAVAARTPWRLALLLAARTLHTLGVPGYLVDHVS